MYPLFRKYFSDWQCSGEVHLLKFEGGSEELVTHGRYIYLLLSLEERLTLDPIGASASATPGPWHTARTFSNSSECATEGRSKRALKHPGDPGESNARTTSCALLLLSEPLPCPGPPCVRPGVPSAARLCGGLLLSMRRSPRISPALLMNFTCCLSRTRLCTAVADSNSLGNSSKSTLYWRALSPSQNSPCALFSRGTGRQLVPSPPHTPHRSASTAPPITPSQPISQAGPRGVAVTLPSTAHDTVAAALQFHSTANTCVCTPGRKRVGCPRS